MLIDTSTGTADNQPGPPGTLRFGRLAETPRDVQIWLPHNETIELLELRTDAPVEPATDPARRVWLHHGSSISQGSDAASPTTTWPALAASLGGVELVNPGLRRQRPARPPGPSTPDMTALAETGQIRFLATGDPAERASGKPSLGVIREELARIVRQRAVGDPHLYHLNGRDLYGAADAAEPSRTTGPDQADAPRPDRGGPSR